VRKRSTTSLTTHPLLPPLLLTLPLFRRAAIVGVMLTAAGVMVVAAVITVVTRMARKLATAPTLLQ
jgi:hypothetical protein